MLPEFAALPIARPLVFPLATVPLANDSDGRSPAAAATSVTPAVCIAKAAKILATTIFFFPVLFFAISDTTT